MKCVLILAIALVAVNAQTCDIKSGIACGEKIEPCIATCKTGIVACASCLASDWSTCCPCIKKVVPKLPFTCPSAVGVQELEYKSLFEIFQTEHKKNYAESEVAGKFAVFKDNVDFINDHNANHAEELGYTVAVNQFADMTKTEYKRTMLGYNALRKPVRETELLDESAAPASIDWTTKGAVTPVKNQGQCGSCWAFSTTGSTEGRNQIKNGKLVSLSEQELTSCASSFGNQGCNGGLMDDGFKFIEKFGLEKEADYKYAGATGTCDKTKEKAADGISAGVVTSFKDVAANSQSQLAAAVAEGPVSVAIEADQS